MQYVGGMERDTGYLQDGIGPGRDWAERAGRRR
ncbi:hypothetical protein ABIA32_001179 [Streptacidiphilus sp. MAP12-20]